MKMSHRRDINIITTKKKTSTRTLFMGSEVSILQNGLCIVSPVYHVSISV